MTRSLPHIDLCRLLCPCLFSIALFSPQDAAAETASDYQQWAVLNADINLDTLAQGLRFSFNGEARRMNAPRRSAEVNGGVEEQNPNTLVMIRPIVGYQFHPLLIGWVGYGFQPIYFVSDVREDINEHRPFLQISGGENLGRFQLSYRTRMEFRYRTTGDQGTVLQGEDEWAYRFRQQLRAAFTLVPRLPWQAIVAPELFLHLNDTNYPSRRGFDQGRLFVGGGYQTRENLRLEAGYLFQGVKRYTDRHQLNHVLWISMNFRWGLPAKSTAGPS